jgi:hypothetical protein
MDAFIVSELLDKKIRLAKLNSFPLTLITNHDNFCTSAYQLPLLEYLIADCYQTLFDSNPITWFSENCAEDQMGSLIVKYQESESSSNYLNNIALDNKEFITFS